MAAQTAMAPQTHVASDIWESFGMELLTFFLTFAFAWIFRVLSGWPERKAPPKHAKSVWATSEAKADRRAGGPAEAPGALRKEVLRVVDEIFHLASGAQHGPQHLHQAGNSARALTMYSDLLGKLKGREVDLSAMCQGSRHSGLDLYTLLVFCAVRSSQPYMVGNLVDDMVRFKVPRTLSFYESTMKQLAGQKSYHCALSMYDRLAADGLVPSPIMCSCLISFAAEVGALDRAVEFFEMLSRNTTPSIRAYMTILRVHGKRQDWESSLATLRSMQARGVALDNLVLNVTLATGVATGNVEATQALLDEAESIASSLPDVVSHNTVIKGHAARGDLAAAKACLQRMRTRGLAPNAITYNTIMDAAVRSSQIDQAWALLAEMRSSHLKPDKFSCSILVKGLSRSAKPQQVEGALALLREVSPTCDASLMASMYQGVLEATFNVQDSGIAAKALTQVREQRVSTTPTALRKLCDLAQGPCVGRSKAA